MKFRPLGDEFFHEDRYRDRQTEGGREKERERRNDGKTDRYGEKIDFL